MDQQALGSFSNFTANQPATASEVTFIHRLPNETLAEIVHWVCDGEAPPLALALVCARWRASLLQTPTLWRDITARLLWEGGDDVDARTNRLRRRLDLSCQVSLDVTIKIHVESLEYDDILFQILSKVDVGRYRSLKLIDHEYTAAGVYSIPFYRFYGRFTRLESLFIDIFPSSSVSIPLQELLAVPPINFHELDIKGNLPPRLQTSSFLSGVRHLTAGITVYKIVREYAQLEQVDVDQLRFGGPISATPVVLPARASFHSLRRRDLSKLDCTHLHTLKIMSLPGGRYEAGIVQMPSLVYLDIPNPLSFCAQICAPHLSSLTMLGDQRYTLPTRWTEDEENGEIIKLFKKETSYIGFHPVHLDLKVLLSQEAIVAVLSHWTQLQHLTLNISLTRGLAEKGPFSDFFIKSELSCPSLITLRLQTRWKYADSQKWKNTASEMFRLRREGALKSVSWTWGNRGEVLSMVTPNESFPEPFIQ